MKYLATNKLNFEFNNRDFQHAAIVMSTIYSNAEIKIKIFCGSFKGDICDNEIYLDALKIAINKGVEMDIIFAEDPNNDSKCFTFLKKEQETGKKISFYRLEQKYLERVASMGINLNHFLLGDQNMLRYEFDTSEYKAYCNFDDKESVNSLADNFEKLKSNSILM